MPTITVAQANPVYNYDINSGTVASLSTLSGDASSALASSWDGSNNAIRFKLNSLWQSATGLAGIAFSDGTATSPARISVGYAIMAETGFNWSNIITCKGCLIGPRPVAEPSFGRYFGLIFSYTTRLQDDGGPNVQTWTTGGAFPYDSAIGIGTNKWTYHICDMIVNNSTIAQDTDVRYRVYDREGNSDDTGWYTAGWPIDTTHGDTVTGIDRVEVIGGFWGDTGTTYPTADTDYVRVSHAQVSTSQEVSLPAGFLLGSGGGSGGGISSQQIASFM